MKLWMVLQVEASSLSHDEELLCILFMLRQRTWQGDRGHFIHHHKDIGVREEVLFPKEINPQSDCDKKSNDKKWVGIFKIKY